jgi:glucose-6-phosphate 1-dehydrogenase
MVMKNSIILIFGITGDLSKRKLIPGLYRLLANGKIDQVRVIGAAIEDYQKASEVLDQAKDFIADLDLVVWQKLVEKFSYCRVDINEASDFVKLAKLVEFERRQYNLTDQILVYCAVFELLYVQLTAQLSQVGIIKRMLSDVNSWCRVVYEKPFGHNYDSVYQLNQSILQFLHEEQIYRVDHYLAKEIVGNIAFVRFTNRIFEPLWNKFSIDSVQITLDESIDIEGRGGYYERYGIIKDMVQNHVLQLMALIAMGTPKSLRGHDMQSAKSQILQKIVCEDGILGQYIGYLGEEGVATDSKTPTFAALKFAINDSRWYGVPFYVRTGKVMPSKLTKIVIKFKDMHCLLAKNCPPGANVLTISIYPKGGFDLEINAKKPGTNDQVMPVKMSYCYDCQFVPQAPNAYESVLSEIMQGETTFAVRIDEIEAAWQISDQIDLLNLPVYQYAKNSMGPRELNEFNQKHQLIWI